MDLDQHLAELARLLDLERAEEKRRAADERVRLTLEERQARGHAVTDLVASDTRGLAGRVLVTFSPSRRGAELPSTRIGVGSIVRVERKKATGPEGDGEPVTGVVARRSRAGFGLMFDGPPPEWIESGVLTLELEPNDVTWERQKTGLRLLGSGEAKHLKRWRELFAEKRPPTFDEHLPFSPSPALNPEQNQAVRRALAARDLALVHGPPGTGKTTVLAEIILKAVQRGERVLAAAASNTAVDNVLDRIVGHGVRVVRLGHPARVTESLLPWTLDEQLESSEGRGVAKDMLDEAHDLLGYSKKQASRGRSRERFAEAREARREAGRLFSEARKLMRAAREQLLENAQVVCATCTGTQEESLSGLHFDLAIVDEATQATEPAALLPLLRADRAVLAGDHLQLPPTVLSPQAAKAGLSRSLFERMLDKHGPAIGTLLREQYRMHEAIMKFPSKELYEGELRANPSVAGHLLKDLSGIAADERTQRPVSFLDTAGKGFDDEIPEGSESRRNPGEAKLVGREVRRLLEAGLRPAQISVIAPYDAQVQALRAVLPQEGLEIDTVDGFQGRENEAVVVSLTRSNASGEVGFLSDVRRMNVAITRARRHLLVVGDSATVSGHPFYRDFIEYVTAAGGYRSAWDEPDEG